MLAFGVHPRPYCRITPAITGGTSGLLTRTLVGCSDVDPHIPVERVRETASVLRALGAEVSERIDPGLAHTVNDAEVVWLHEHLQGLTA